MAKLKCDLHKSRVFFLNSKMIHRGGWGDICSGKTATIGKNTYMPTDVNRLGNLESVTPAPASNSEKLLMEIFHV